MTDPQLVARAQEGDLPAFEELVWKYQREIYNLACRLVQDPEEAKDMAQQTFMQAYVHIREFPGQTQFRTWLFRIAINQCYNFFKSKKKFGDPVDSQELVIVEVDNPQEELMAAGRVLGARLDLRGYASGLSATALLFGEDHGRVVLSLPFDQRHALAAVARRHGVRIFGAGRVTEAATLHLDTGARALAWDVVDLRRRYFDAIPRRMARVATSSGEGE